NELVISASKRPQKTNETPSPVYVFTAEDIERTGVRNLMELVQFIPGFYVYPRLDHPFVISNRGIRSDTSDKILFLIDGIPINNISSGGAVNMHLFPGLDKVKRVEVISGPGSTMWGSDASLGIIHLITKDAKDIDGHRLNVNLASEDNHAQFNFLSGKEFAAGEYMVSFTYAQNDGHGVDKYGYENFVFDFDWVPWNDQRANFNWMYPSYELFAKLRINNFTIKALASERNIYEFFRTSLATDWHDIVDFKSINRARDIHIELGHHAELSDTMTLDTKFTAKHIEYLMADVVEVGSNHGSDFFLDPADPNFREPIGFTEKYPEDGVGLEFLLNWDINEKNKLLAGTRIRVVNAGPGGIDFFNVETDQEPDPSYPTNSTYGDAVFYDETTDTTIGVYAEDTFYATDRLTLIGGVRVDYNDPRETVAVVMPRGAAIYKFSDALSAKYMYNTGYVRPQMKKSYAVKVSSLLGSVKESEKIRAHDVALIYNTRNTQLILDLFQMTVYDIYGWQPDPTNQWGKHVNQGDIFTKGVELSLKRSFWDGKLLFDLNYGYAKADKEDEFGNKSTYYQGIPHHVYAAGLNYLFTENISLFATVHGWRDLEMNGAGAYGRRPPPHPDYNGDYLVDLNLRIKKLLNDRLDLSLYVLNVTDREARLQALESWHAWWTYARGRSIGIKTTWKF
ncbi:MAG: TonB-dependent receptor, partial [Deltaproteobacteria bacterium]|nr:TonB-dependent receptor [Deltaproteobacteria bacterium]